MLLKDILKGIARTSSAPIAKVSVCALTDDSRAVKRGGMFVAVSGHAHDGNAFISSAIKRGAAVIVSDKDFTCPHGVLKVMVDDAREALPVIADNFYGHPWKRCAMVGITGTNGKTTITYLLESIARVSRCGTAVIGTINYRINRSLRPAKNTTPGTFELEAFLSEAVRRKVRYGIMEVSSHSLAQNRTGEICFDAAIFTNITGDHLDYHKTFSRYRAAKALLLDKMKPSGVVILNADDKHVSSLVGRAKNRVVTFGVRAKATYRAYDINPTLSGTSFSVMTPRGAIRIVTPLVGMHNVSNILAAVACAESLGISRRAIARGIGAMTAVPGRLEAVDAGQPFRVFVDFAHTHDALENILSVLRRLAPARVITVFGCGGNRDRTKRPLMARAACRYSDHVVITSDNPRFENPEAIVKEIVRGVRGMCRNYETVVDRRKAIARALACAAPDDVVVIAGKGHEDYQIIRDKTIPFDDRKVVGDILRKARHG